MKHIISEIERLNREIHKMQTRIVYFERQGNILHPAQFQFVRLLGTSAEGMSQTELAQKARVSDASVGISVRRLEKIGLVKRVPDENDKRILHVSLTEKGRKYGNSARQYVAKFGEVKYAGLSEQNLEEYHKVLAAIHLNCTRYFELIEGVDE